MTPLEFEQQMAAVRQAANLIEIHLGVWHRNPASRSISDQIAQAIEQHRRMIAEIWTPPPKPMSAVPKKTSKKQFQHGAGA
jgi:hypothetical protein